MEERLCQIGLTRNEARIYLELLKIGPQPVSVIAKRAKLNRTTSYSVLKCLEKKGLVASYQNEKLRLFVANDPNSLIAFIDRKCRTFDYYRAEMLQQIPKFRSLISNYEFQKPVVKYFEGLEGIKQTMYDILNDGKECMAYMALDKWFDLGLEDFLLEYSDFRQNKRRIPLRAILPDSAEIRNFFKKHYKSGSALTKLLFVCREDFPNVFANEIMICGGKTVIFHLDKTSEFGIIIESMEIADTQRTIFEMAWRGCNAKVIEY